MTRRTIALVFTFALLAIAPVAPYFHLAVVPHRYCITHKAFEERSAPSSHERHDETPKRPGQPESSHETCLLAGLALQAFDSGPVLTTSIPVLVPRQHGNILPRNLGPHSSLDRVSLAPKTSPPA